MNSAISVLLVLALPPALIVFLALVWARGKLRKAIAAVMFLIPVAIFAYLLATASQPNRDNLFVLGLAVLGEILLTGATIGAILGGLVILFRHLKRRRQAV